MKKILAHKKKLTLFVASLFLLAIAVYFYTASRNYNEKVTTITYVCNDNVEVTVTYDNNSDISKALLTMNSITTGIMSQVEAASGVKYSDNVYIWWTKGDTGFFTDATEKENVILKDCVAKK